MMRIFRFVFSHPLTRRSKLRALFRVLHWQIISRFRKENLIPWIAGTKLVVRRGMTGATGNIYVGLHEFVDMIFLLHFLRPGDLFLDVGANVGSYTILASGVCKARTVAFEPDPETARHLQKNIEINALSKLVLVRQVAVGAEEATVRFTSGRDAVNQVVGPEVKNARLVPQKRLDDMLTGQNPIMMKMDVEGYEEQALLGAEQLLFNSSLMVIELETVSENTEQMLKRHGFERMYYDPYHRLVAIQPFDIASLNTLFIRNSTFVRARVHEAAKVRVFDNLI
jgi:FkbM family methyltransferase